MTAPAAPTLNPTVLLSVDPAGIPRELVDDPSWLPAVVKPKAGRPGLDKIPSDPISAKPAKWRTPGVCLPFAEAHSAYANDPRFRGVGYIMHADAGIIGLDLDGCVDADGTVAPWAREIIEQFAGAHWGLSISGTGVRGFCRGSLPDGVQGARSKIEGCTVEMYSGQRYLVVTGQAIEPRTDPTEPLPRLQEAVDALYTRLAAGRTRAAGKAVESGLTGRVDDLTPDELAILEAIMGGRKADRMMQIWTREDEHASEVSEADFALEREIARHAIAHGLREEALSLAVERVMRAGPYRSKWDEARGAVTWLAQDVANAIATTEKRRDQYQYRAPNADPDWANCPVDGEPPTWPDYDAGAADQETVHQLVARLRRELAQERAAHAVLQTAYRVTREENEQLREVNERNAERAQEVKAVLRNKVLGSTEKILAIVAVWLMESKESRDIQDEGARDGEIHVHYPDLAEASGTSTETVGRYMKRLTEGTDAPLSKRSPTVWRDVTDPLTGGVSRLPSTRTFLRARGEGSILTAVAEWRPAGHPKHGGERLPRCADHPDADVIIRKTTLCSVCRCVLETPAESLRRQVDRVISLDGQVDSVGSEAPTAEPTGESLQSPDPLHQQDACVEEAALDPLEGDHEVDPTEWELLGHQNGTAPPTTGASVPPLKSLPLTDICFVRVPRGQPSHGFKTLMPDGSEVCLDCREAAPTPVMMPLPFAPPEHLDAYTRERRKLARVAGGEE